MRKKRAIIMEGVKCPECKSTQMVSAGYNYYRNKKQRRYHCLNCDLHTIHPKRVRNRKVEEG